MNIELLFFLFSFFFLGKILFSPLTFTLKCQINPQGYFVKIVKLYIFLMR